MTETAGRTRTRLWTQVGAGLLILLWAAAAVPLTMDAVEVVRTHTVTRVLGAPTDEVVVQLQEERRLSAGYLAGVVDRGALAAQRARTDRAGERLRTALSGRVRSTAAGAEAVRRTDDLLRAFDGRTRLRATVDARSAALEPVLAGYTGIVAAAFAGAPWLWPDRTTGTGSALLALGRAREALSREDAALVGGSGRAGLDGPARARVAELVLTRRVLLAEAADQLPAASRPDFRALADGPATGRLRAREDELIAAAPDDVDAAATARSTELDEYRTRLRGFEVAAVREARRAAVPGAMATVAGAGLLAGVGLVAVVAVLAALRRIVGRAGAPAAAAPVVAGAGSPGAGAPLLHLLLEQNRRNQALLHRLLRLLDGLQRRVGDDATLGELFRIDHLASRVRRNVEKSVALTGGTPGRRWTRPVPLEEVVRAAAAEVPDFERVSTAQVEPAGLAGAAVADVMHLLAELIENAVVFSPAETRVRVSGRRDADDYLLTVADHGPGMSDDDLRTAAEMLDRPTPPETDTWHGLYAAGRFAERAGVAVRLHSDDDGLRAEVRLPAALLVADAGPATDRPAPRRVRPGAAMAGVGGDD
ncbi:sensor histidine kinase [Jidongwangia harbinensis]|uniref:sensor histidine kinase n=1 Tax=Jidongwangia harbinensis TaxID=2878561 RepID=UPI001CD9947D|nr:ATP-binding protein [Jidongwangia harbinensis]MCA2217809.1 ATP-binding protein [Jidongwangia harbinensis]